MQKSLKKPIALFLVVLMLMTSVPLNVFAGMDWSFIKVSAAEETVDEKITEDDKSVLLAYKNKQLENKNKLLELTQQMQNDICELDSNMFKSSTTEKPFAPMTTFSLRNAVATVSDESDFSFDYSEETQMLTISGSGAMPDYELADEYETVINTPWFSYAADIKKVVIEEGITSVGAFAFALCANLTEVVLPEGITSIGDYAFAYCINLSELVLPDSIETIEDGAFMYMFKIEKINLPENLQSLGKSVFTYLLNLKEVTVPEGVTSFTYNLTDDSYAYAFALESIINNSSTAILDQPSDWCFDSVKYAEAYSYLMSNYFKNELSFSEFIPGITFTETALIEDTVNYLNDNVNTSYVASDYNNFNSLIEHVSEELLAPHILNIPYPSYYSITCINESAQHEYCKENVIKHKIIGESDFCVCFHMNGTIGDNITWTIDTETKTLTLNGEGEIADVETNLVVYDEFIDYIIFDENSNITYLNGSPFYGLNITELSIPKTVTYIDSELLFSLTSIAEINVDNENPYYYSVDGIMFKRETLTVNYVSQQVNVLVAYPNGKTASEYIVPDDTYAIYRYAFYKASIDKLTIPSTTQLIFSGAFVYSNIKEIIFEGMECTLDDNAFESCYSKLLCLPESDIYNFTYEHELGNQVVVIEDKEISSIEAVPAKTEYGLFDVFSITDLTVKVNFVDGTYAERKIGYSVSGFQSKFVGDCELTVTYGDFSDTYTVTILDVDNITLNETKNIEVGKAETVYIKFVPSTSGTYKFYSSSSSDTYGYLYDANTNQLAFDDENGEGSNFLIVYALEAGKVYYFGVRYYSSSKSGSFDVTLECGHDGEWEITTSPTCTENGEKTRVCIRCGKTETDIVNALGHDYIYTTTEDVTCTQAGKQTVNCSRCTYSEEYELAKLLHTDENGDGTCEVCGGNSSDILIDETRLINITAHETTYLRFIPEISGEYVFYSSASSDTYGYLYDANKNELTNNDDGGKNGNFSITYELEEGKVYYWGARYYSSSYSGSFNVTLEYICKHFDEDFDNICDFCGEITSPIANTGNCGAQGDNVTYILYENGLLVISGSGAMADYSHGDSPFYNSTIIESVIIKNGVTSIGNYAFSSCGLTSITIPDSVTSIEDSAFRGCTGLTSITIPDSVTRIGSSAFSSCGLTSITIPDSVTSIGSGAFDYCSSLKSITIPKSVTSIGKSNYCFFTSIVVDEDNNYYSSDEYGVLYNKDKTEIIWYPAGLGIKEYTLPESVTSIDGCAFWYGRLTKITIPEGVTSIGNSAFFCCVNLESITIPEGVTSISRNTFYNCNSLTNITIPKSVTSIAYGAFWSCGLTSITIPEGVTSIGDRAFENCTNLTNITIFNPECEIYDNSNTISSTATIYGYKNSTAQEYAEKYGRTFKIICDHINTTEHEAVDPTCTTNGYTAGVYCDYCKTWIEGHETIQATNHTYNNEWEIIQELSCFTDEIKVKICSVCGEKSGSIGFTSENLPKCTGTNYTNNMNRTFDTYSVPGASRIILHFSSNSYVESGYDYVYIYAGDSVSEENLIGRYTGSLAETTVTIDASSFTIRMTTDSSVTNYGFEISSIDYYSSDNVEITPTPGHIFGDWETVTEVTCTASGSRERTCNNCDKTEKETIPSFGHNYGDWVTISEATCDSNGVQKKTCSVCGNSLTNSLAALGHTYSFIETIDPSCTEYGSDIYMCDRCDSEYTKTISPRHKDSNDDGLCDFCNEPYVGVLDLVFVIDTTGSMGNEISVVKQNITNYANRLANSNIPYYISVVDYRDFTDRAGTNDYPYSVIFDFTNNNDEILAGVNKLSLGYGGDGPETVYSGLVTGLDELHWGEDSVRKVILIGDAEPLDPEPYTNFTLDSTCEYLNNNDISVYSISTGGSEVIEFAEIAEATGGDSYVCSSDNEFNQVLTDIIDSIPESLHIHTYEESRTDATCTQGGITLYHCTGCGKDISTKTEPLGHDYSEEWTVDKEPTCTGNGSKSHHCSRCDSKSNVTAIESLGHDYGDWARTTDPTCTKTGIEKRTCSRCNYVESQTIAALGHDYSEEWTVDKEPTCTENGSKSHHCSRCDSKSDVTAIESLGHDYGDWARTTDPTCTKTGIEKRTCSRCNYVESQTIAALGHDYSEEWTVDKEPTCTENGSKSHHCSRCDSKSDVTAIESLGHDYGDWARTTDPTCTKTGIEKRTCSRCNYVESQTIAALGHDYSEEWTVDKEPTCTENGSKSHHCSRCDSKSDVTAIDALGHNYVSVVIDPTCTKDGYTTHTCTVCSSIYSDSYVDALGHSTTEWTEKKAATCTAKGTEVSVCETCGSTVTRSIEALGHSYGEWYTEKNATVLAEGLSVRVCERCGRREESSIEKLIVDINESNEYGLANFTVVNAQTLEPIEGASIFVSTEEDGENTFYTDTDGKVSIVLPVGEQNISVYANGCIVRNLSVNINSGENDIPQIGLSDLNIYDVEISSKEMNLDEIKDAEINVKDPENTNVYKYELKIQFEPEIDWVSIVYYMDDNNNYYGGYTIEDDDEDDDDHDVSKEDTYELHYHIVGSGASHHRCSRIYVEKDENVELNYIPNYPENDYIFDGWYSDSACTEKITHKTVSEKETTVYGTLEYIGEDTEPEPTPEPIYVADKKIYPVSEYMFLIIDGEVSWLKEMFDVQMLIVNNSNTDTLSDLNATLTLPEGLSLAKMSGEAQSLSQYVGEVANGSSKSVHWYVKGDEAGSYDVTANLTGKIMPFGEKIDDTFKLENSICVWSGNALNLNFELPSAAYYGDDYPVKITLTNVSDKTLYNVSSLISGVEQSKIVHYSNDSVKEVFYKGQSDIGKTFAQEFKPGDKLVMEVPINILFESELIEYSLQKLIDVIDGAENITKAIKAVKKVYEIANSIKNLADNCIKAIDGFVDSIDSKEKRELIKELGKSLEDLNNKIGGTGNKNLDNLIKLSNLGLDAELDLLAEDPEKWLEEADPEKIENLISGIQSAQKDLENGDETTAEDEEFNIFDSLRTAISAIPIVFTLKDTFFNDDFEENTTKIPVTYTFSETGPRYFGVSNVSKYISALLTAGFGGLLENSTFGFILNIPGMDEIIDPEAAREYIKATEKEIERFQAKDATGEVTFTAWIESNDVHTMARTFSANDDFDISCDNDTAKFEDGKLTFTGSGLISVIPKNTHGGTLYIQDSEGNVKSYVITVVEEHTCEAGDIEIVLGATNDTEGFGVKRCVTCDEIMDIVFTESCINHEFGEWITDNAVSCEEKGMMSRACKNCGYIEMSFDDATGHTEKIINKVEGTCTNPGYTGDVVCEICNETITTGEVVKATGHNYETVVTVPTCTEDGYTTYTCSACNDSYVSDEVEPLGHSGGTADCKDKAICEVCGEAYGNINSDNHKNIVTDKAISATCTSTGVTEGSHCDACGEVIVSQTTTEKLSHTEEILPAKEATCTNTGLTEGKQCSTCGEILVKQTETSKLGHNMGNFIIVEQPTCTENGIETAKCSRCDYSETKEISAVGHNYEDDVCTNCGDTKSNDSSYNHHKYGFKGFIWKIFRLIHKIFRIIKFCGYGVALY